MSTGTEAPVTVESVQARLHACNSGELPTCPKCGSAPVHVELTDLPSPTPTGKSRNILGKVMHLRPAVVVGCSTPEDCTWIGVEVKGLVPPEGSSFYLDAAPVGNTVSALAMLAPAPAPDADAGAGAGAGEDRS